MKKIILGSVLFLIPALGHASDSVWKSSTTAVAVTTKSLCGTAKAIFHGACVNTGTAGTLTIYDSRGGATSAGPAIETTTPRCQLYDVNMSSGLTYTNSAAANVTLLYDCH